MNVLWVVPGGVDRSGTERVIPALLWLMARVARRHALTVVALAQEAAPGAWDLLGARVINVGDGTRRLRAVRAMWHAHRERRFDLVHAFWAVGAGGAAAAFCALAGVPLVVHVAGGELVALPAIGYGGARRFRSRREAAWVLRGAGAITVASRLMREQVDTAGHAATIIPLGVDRTAWPLVPPRERASGAPLKLVHVASINPVKDQCTLVDACAALRSAGVPFELDVVGEDTLAGAVQRHAADVGLTSIRWHGFLPQDAVRPIVQAADLFVLTSLHESGCVAVLEAAMCGVPAVGTAVGHIGDLAPHAAVSVPTGDPHALAAAVRALAGDERRRLALGRAAQAWAAAHDADHTFEQVERLYESLAAGAGR